MTKDKQTILRIWRKCFDRGLMSPSERTDAAELFEAELMFHLFAGMVEDEARKQVEEEWEKTFKHVAGLDKEEWMSRNAYLNYRILFKYIED